VLGRDSPRTVTPPYPSTVCSNVDENLLKLLKLTDLKILVLGTDEQVVVKPMHMSIRDAKDIFQICFKCEGGSAQIHTLETAVCKELAYLNTYSNCITFKQGVREQQQGVSCVC
jgi:hypothetical protein